MLHSLSPYLVVADVESGERLNIEQARLSLHTLNCESESFIEGGAFERIVLGVRGLDARTYSHSIVFEDCVGP